MRLPNVLWDARGSCPIVESSLHVTRLLWWPAWNARCDLFLDDALVVFHGNVLEWLYPVSLLLTVSLCLSALAVGWIQLSNALYRRLISHQGSHLTLFFSHQRLAWVGWRDSWAQFIPFCRLRRRYQYAV